MVSPQGAGWRDFQIEIANSVPEIRAASAARGSAS
jgi:hypothetical protein